MNAATRMMLTQVAVLAGVAVVTAGLYVWGAADAWGQRADRVESAAWSIRCFAASAIAAGQVIFALAVVPSLFAAPAGSRRPSVEQAYAVSAGLFALLAAVAGAALAAAAGW